MPSAAALNTGTHVHDQQQNTCVFCNSTKHSSRECHKPVNEKRGIVAKRKLCFLCIRSGHRAGNCRSRHRCKKCQRRHHSSLCDSPEEGTKEKPNAGGNSENAALSSIANNTRRGVVLLQTAQAFAVSSGGQKQVVRCLLDSGSHLSFIKTEASKKLGLQPIGSETLDIHSFGSKEPVRATRQKVRLQLQSLHDSSKSVIIEVLETPEICGAVLSLPSEDIVSEMERRGLKLADAPDTHHEAGTASKIDILIGSDWFWEVAKGKSQRLGNALVAMDTLLGWTIQGPTSMTSTSVSINTVAVMKAVCEDDLLSTQMKQFWELDAIGIAEAESEPAQRNEIIQKFEKSITFTDDRYQVCFPWKPNCEQLGDNYAVAAKRTEGLLRKLKCDPVMFHDYDAVFQEQLQAGVIEEVPDPRVSEVLYYLPHRAVLRESSATTRLRVVFDASAHAKAVPSLNECLESGPNLNAELLSVLIRFREKPIAFTGDIEKAFLQISIAPRDRDAVRFLWIDSINTHGQPIFKEYRMCRVPFGVTSSPYLLAATIRFHLHGFETTDPIICKLLREGLYVDDLIAGAEDSTEAYQLSTGSSNVLRQAGMNLRKFKTNSPELRKLWSNDGKDSIQSRSLPSNHTEKVLGITWDTSTDHLTLDVDPMLQFLIKRDNTKRWILKAVARVFDPLGLLAPFTLRAKALFQELWVSGIAWDEQLLPEVSAKFNSWCEELPELKQVKLPRHYFNNVKTSEITNVQLHVFVDASERAYAAAAYLRYETTSGSCGVNLVAAKTRIAPLKKLTLPRLELMGAILGARLSTTLLQALSIQPHSVHLWTDSQIALQWIKSSASDWKPFISNRVREIQTSTDPQSWQHVPGKQNPADLPTRGSKVRDLLNDTFWWHGPAWLSSPDAKPTANKSLPPSAPVSSTEEMNCELRSAIRAIHQGINDTEPSVEALLDIQRFSSLNRLQRVTAWIIRFTNNCRNNASRTTGDLSAKEVQAAELYWIKRSQRDSYPAEVSCLTTKEKFPTESTIALLHPILDEDGIVCVGGRLRNNELSYRQKHPWILSSKHWLADLVCRHHHERVMHGGINDTLVDVRERFWIIKGRQLVKKVVQHCLICRRFRAKPSSAITAPLPTSRTTPAAPFEVCGLDFAGPLYTRDGSKTYIALFTCAITRAVHLELVTDMTADKFLLAFRRLIGRRGIVRTVISDNAKTFKRADADLKALFGSLRHPEVTRWFGELRIQWNYIADRAPWWGGFYERMVRSVKEALRRVLGQARLNYEELETVLIEAEAAVNSRPLSYVYNDPDEPSPLCPSHFLVGKRLTALPTRTFTEQDQQLGTRKDINKRWKYRQQINERFWQRWMDEYLLALRSAHHHGKAVPTKPLQVGDLVLIGEPKIPRLCWRTAIVDEVFPGRDGHIRSCMLRLPNGTKLRRPVQLLYLLEPCVEQACSTGGSVE